MEILPPSPFESTDKPEQTGNADPSKKKEKDSRKGKKTTKVAKKVAKDLVSLETEDPTKQLERKPRTKGFEELLGIKPGPVKEAPVAEDRTDEAEADTPETEGELSGDGEIVLGTSESSVELPAAEVTSDTHAVPEAPAEPAEAPESKARAEDTPEITGSETVPHEAAEATPTPPEVPPPFMPIIETSAATESPDSVVADAFEYEPMETEPTGVPRGRRMIDPSERVQAEAAAARYRAETVTPINEDDVEDAYYRGTKRGTSRGVLAGGIFGYMLGRHGRKEAVKQAQEETKREVAKRDKEIQRLSFDQQIAAARLEEVKRTQEYMASAIDHPSPDRDPERPLTVLRAEAPAPALAEAAPTVIAVEKPPVPAEQRPKKPEALPEEQPITEETYRPPTDRRVEMSAWHRIEVDAATGKAVESPEVAYGEEFKREQRQEQLHVQRQLEQDAAVAGHAVLMGMESSGQDTQTASSAAPKPKTPRPSATQFWQANKSYIKQQLTKRTTDTTTWLIALGVFVVLFLSGVLR